MSTAIKTDIEYSETLLNARARSNFITIPQTTIDYKELHDRITSYSQVTYCLTKLEHHEDENELHIHLVVKYKQQIKIKTIHNLIMSCRGEIRRAIDYQKPDKICAIIQYLKKARTSVEGKPYLEYGEAPLDPGRIQKGADPLVSAIQLANNGQQEEAIQLVKDSNPRDYLLYKNTIIDTLKKEEEDSVRKKYKRPDISIAKVQLTPSQQKVWDLLQEQPKERRIIWISGGFGVGKSFLYNYIKENHEYKMFDAGQSSSFDNVAYSYDEEGVIAWDLPKSFDFNTYGDAIGNVIEKFSDFGQSITSKKYTGKTQYVLGHVIVFSNSEPIRQLAHRDVIHIKLHRISELLTSDIESDQEPILEIGKARYKRFMKKSYTTRKPKPDSDGFYPSDEDLEPLTPEGM